MHFKLPQKRRHAAVNNSFSNKMRIHCCYGLPTIHCNPDHHCYGSYIWCLQGCSCTLAVTQLEKYDTFLKRHSLQNETPLQINKLQNTLDLRTLQMRTELHVPHFSTTTSSSCPELLHYLVPSGSWAAAGPPWRAYASAPAPGACCIPAGWWARSGAGVGSAHSASSGWYWDGGTPAPAWTRADAAAWRAPGPSVSAFCLIPNRRTERIIRFFVLTWISAHNVTFHFVHKGISLFPRHLRTECRVSMSYQKQTAPPLVIFPSSFHFSSSCSRCSTGFTVSIFWKGL